MLISAASVVVSGVLAATVRERNRPAPANRRRGSPLAVLNDRSYVAMTLLNTVVLLNNPPSP